jgi:mono/diheme cytochrome c family protein
MRATPGLVLFIGLLACGAVRAQSLSMPEHAGELPPGEGREIVAVACTQCHTLTPIVGLRDGPIGWRRHVHNMVIRGAQLNGEQIDTVVAYLNANFGMGRPVADASPVVLAEGAGKPLVETRCTVCHGLARVTAGRRSDDAWRTIVRDMFGRYGYVAPDDEEAQIVGYLATHYGTKK